MTPLDPITARCFPTLARFARRQWWLGALGLVMILCALSFSAGVVVGSYRGKVADENYYAWGRQLNDLQQQYQAHHPKEMRTTKAQSAVMIDRIQKAKEQP